MNNRLAKLEKKLILIEKEIQLIKSHLFPKEKKEVSNFSMDENEDQSAFRNIYDELDDGKGSVKIYKIREKLAWDDEKFNNVIQSLADDNIIVLNKDDMTTLNIRALGDSYMDNNGNTYLSLTYLK